MRIVIWNCAMGLARKLAPLMSLRPDVAIIAECAELPQANWATTPPTTLNWIGDNSRKGLCVVTFGHYRARLDESYAPHLKYYLPVQVEGPTTFNLLAVWAFHHRLPSSDREHDPRATGSMPVAIEHYRRFLRSAPSVVAGDFNNNLVWDKPGKLENHSNCVQSLNLLGLISAYHVHYRRQQGTEQHPTLYWRDRKKNGLSFHIDYCFVPSTWQASIKAVSVGEHESWSTLSDHMPLVVDLGLPTLMDTTTAEG